MAVQYSQNTKRSKGNPTVQKPNVQQVFIL